MQTTIAKPDTPDLPALDIRPLLDVNTFVSLIQRGMSQRQIAKLYRRSPQAISEWKRNHADEIYQLLQPDSYLAQSFKQEAINALNSCTKKDRDNASYLQKMTVAGIAIDKYKLLQSQSTSDVDKDIVIHIHNNLFTHSNTSVTPNPDMNSNKVLDTIDIKVERQK